MQMYILIGVLIGVIKRLIYIIANLFQYV